MALATDETAHFLSRGVSVHIVVLHTCARLQCTHSFDEPRPRYAKLHRLRVMTINAGNRMRNKLARFRKRHLIEFFEAFHQVAITCLRVRHYNRSVAMQTGARLLCHLLTLRVSLVVEHECVSAFFAE